MSLQSVAPTPSADARPTWSRHLIMIWLVGMFVLLPVEAVKLPFNVTPVDVWTVGAMPLVWLSIRRGRQVISFYYMVPMWLILVGSFASTFAAPAPRNGLIVVLKELFAFVWFLTVAVALVRLSPRDFRRVLLAWSTVVLLNGLLIVAQFFSPGLWRFMAASLERAAHYDIYRPSGLLSNANGAAFFQLLGFVPLLLLRLPCRTGIVLGLLLLTTMMATGSMASILSFTAGALVTVAILVLKGHTQVITALVGRLFVVATLLGALLLLVIGSNERYQTHLHRILIGRADRSSEGRFDLWQRGLDVFVEEKVFLWGVGPENFRVVDGNDNQLHNDFLAFFVERGLISTLGLSMFALLAVARAASLFLMVESRRDANAELVVVVLLAAMVAAFVYSLTHQVFHNRQLWLILALQEALFFSLAKATVASRLPPQAPRTAVGAVDF